MAGDLTHFLLFDAIPTLRAALGTSPAVGGIGQRLTGEPEVTGW